MSKTFDARQLGLTAGAVFAGASLAAVSAACATPVPEAAAAPTAVGTAQVERESSLAVASDVVRVAHPAGVFSYSQDAVASPQELARAFGGVDRVLCGAGEGLEAAEAPGQGQDAAQWQITVGGDGVEAAYTASLGDLAQDGSYRAVMGCTCLGNPADGRATANADVCGVTLSSILDKAGLAEGANTVTFVAADGTEESLPLSYVLQRMSLIVYEAGGEPLANSMGGVNPLWLGATAARYFTRDVVEIRVEARDAADVPAAPGTPEAGDAYVNRPNVGVLGAEADGVA